MDLKLKAQGLLLVLIGAASYGVLATIVKYSNVIGIHTSVLTLVQSVAGVVFLFAYAWFNQKYINKHPIADSKIHLRSKINLMIFGTSTGLTSCFYYSSLQYIPVSFAIILLMQSIWMGLVLEAILKRQGIELYKLAGGALVLFGTVLAANVLSENYELNLLGLALGLLAAMSYTVTLYASSSIEMALPSYERSKYLVLGGLFVVLIYWNVDLIHHFKGVDFIFWGFLLALFGTILPPLLFTRGIPLIGIGMGAILASVELPVSILSAKFVLGETMSLSQWLGVLIIIVSVVVVNRKNLIQG